MMARASCSRGCRTCSDMAAELVQIMTAHLKAEGDLVEAMFVTKDSAAARHRNRRCDELLRIRRHLIEALKTHVEQEHGKDGVVSPEFALP